MLSSRPVQLNIDGPYPHHNVFPTKTPKRTTKGAKVENAVLQATVNGKASLKSAPVNTPYHHKTANPQRILKDGAGAGQKIILATVARGSRPLGDKTPFPNRNLQQMQHTPLQQMQKLGSLLDGKGELQRRPSSTRTNLRFRKSGGREFETPMNPGNPWEVDEGDILLQPPEEVVHAEPQIQDDFDEIEYVPQVPEVPYQPPFDFEMPNYKVLGKRLFDLAHSYPYDDTPPPVVDWDPSKESLGSVSWETMLPSSRIDLSVDDPFRQALKPKNVQAKPAPKLGLAKPSFIRPQLPVTSQTTVSSKSSSTVRPIPVRPGLSTRTQGASRLPVSKPSVPNITVTSTTNTQRPGPNRIGRTNPVTMTTPAAVGRPAVMRNGIKVPGNVTSSRPVQRHVSNMSAKSNLTTTGTSIRPSSVTATDKSRPRPTTSASYYRGPKSGSSMIPAKPILKQAAHTSKANNAPLVAQNSDIDVIVLSVQPQEEDFFFDI